MYLSYMPRTNFHLPKGKKMIIFFTFVAIYGMTACLSAPTISTETNKPLADKPLIKGAIPPADPMHNPYKDTLLLAQYIRCIFQDSKGNYWFGPAGESVVMYDGQTLNYIYKKEFFQGHPTAFEKDYTSIHAIEEDQQGNLWFGTDLGLVQYDGTRFRSYTSTQGLTNTEIGRGSIMCDKKGQLWIGTKAGVFILDQSKDNARIKCNILLPQIKVTDFLEDRHGNIWIASKDAGIFLFDGEKASSLPIKDGAGDNYAGGLAEDKDGNIWFTTRESIGQFNGSSITYYNQTHGLGGTEIWGIYIASNGIMWVTARGSTSRIDPTLGMDNKKAYKVFTPEHGINCCVQSMYEDRKGNMWFGTGQGLYRYGDKGFYQVKQNGPWEE